MSVERSDVRSIKVGLCESLDMDVCRKITNMYALKF